MNINKHYEDLENYNYVFYLMNGKLHMLDMTNKAATTENTGLPWYRDAFGNCLIHLSAKRTDRLYMFKSAEKILGIRYEDFIENIESFADKVICNDDNE